VRLVGREREQSELQRFYDSAEAEFVVVYGRRRVGKTCLVHEFFGDRLTFAVTGVATSERAVQLRAFDDALADQSGRVLPASADWFEAFNRLRDFLRAVPRRKGAKKVVFIDEMPWLDTPRSGFVTALEHFWNGWAAGQPDILLVVCGSATSWISSKLLKNRGGLHNRVTGRIVLEPFSLKECAEYLDELHVSYRPAGIAETYMALGGIPYYLRQLKPGLSVVQNIDRLCFAQNAPLAGEFDELYRSLFHHPGRHIEVVRALARVLKGLTREEILAVTKLPPGGSLTSVLRDLEQCGFIERTREFTKSKKGYYYRLVDPFTLFYLKHMEHAVGGGADYWASRAGSPAANAWRGYTFELICSLHLPQIKRALGIAGVATQVSSWRSRRHDPGAQIDLVIDRRDRTINLCEIKFTTGEFTIEKRYREALERKVQAFQDETGTTRDVHLTLITTTGVRPNKHSHIVQSEVTLADLFA
jgi:AAA+ ATPase superfamily predicted ATPase